MIFLHEAEGLIILFQFLAESLRICLAHPAAQNIKGVVLILCAGGKAAHIEISGIGFQLPASGSEAVCLCSQRFLKLLIDPADLFIDSGKLMLQFMGRIHRGSLIFIRQEKPFKMQRCVNCIDLIAKRLRHKIHQPHILCIFLAFVHHRIDGIVHIIHEFIVILMRHASKPEFDILKM